MTSSEAVRVNAIYALTDRLPGADLAPYGFQSTGPTVVTNADLLLEQTDTKSAFTTLVKFPAL